VAVADTPERNEGRALSRSNPQDLWITLCMTAEVRAARPGAASRHLKMVKKASNYIFFNTQMLINVMVQIA
jgi:hypothetical protein